MLKPLRLLVVGLLLAAPLGLMVGQAYAASGTLYLSPASGTVINGNTIDVVIHENSGGTAVNGVQADLNFPVGYLNVVSVTAGGAFGIVAQNQYSNGSGTVNYGAGTITPVTGDQIVATVRFQAVASSGTAAVTFANSSAVTQADGMGTPLTLTMTNGNYTDAAPPSSPPPPSPSPSPTPVPRRSGSPSPSPSPSPNPNPTTLQITKVAATDIGLDNATITWTTSAAATSEVDYGPNTSHSLVAKDSSLVTAHQLKLSAGIEPGVTYHYVVKSQDAAGNLAASTDYTFTTKGASLVVTVTNQKGQAVAGAKVSLSYSSGTTISQLSQKSYISGLTDKHGMVTLSGFPATKLSGSDKYFISELTGTITFKGQATAIKLAAAQIGPKTLGQNVTYKINTPANNPLVFLLPPLALLVAIVALIKSGLLSSAGRSKYFPPRAQAKMTPPTPLNPNPPSQNSEITFVPPSGSPPTA